MPLPKVLVADPVSQRGVEELAAGGALEVVVNTGLKEAELIALIPKFSALVVRSQTKVTAAVLDAAKKLKVVGRAGVGVDNVDVDAATRHGVIVMNTPGGNTISTAEHAFSLLMSIARSIPQADASVKAGKWDRKKYEGVELYNKTLGILGMGRIGQAIARRGALGFGMPVIYHNRSRLPADQEGPIGARYVDKATLLREADHLVLVLPYSAGSHHAIGAAELAQMKPTATLTNIARGGIVDDAALARALSERRISAAGLDVFEGEPAVNPALLDLPNVVLTPHIASATERTRRAMADLAADNLIAALAGSRPPTPVNPGVLPLAGV